jgi:hypothetical protein
LNGNIQGDQAISTTLRSGRVPTGFKAEADPAVLDMDKPRLTSQLGASYLSATDPIRDAEGESYAFR